MTDSPTETYMDNSDDHRIPPTGKLSSRRDNQLTIQRFRVRSPVILGS